MEKKIITISREYGSGGRQIGLTAAKKLGMEFYDKELIDAAAKEIGFPAEIIADREQRLTNSLLYNFAIGTLYGLSYPKEPKLSELPLTEQIRRRLSVWCINSSICSSRSPYSSIARRSRISRSA